MPAGVQMWGEVCGGCLLIASICSVQQKSGSSADRENLGEAGILRTEGKIQVVN